MLRADYTFVNQRLAEHYEIPKVYGSHFRRVTLPDDRRAGILGQAGILVATNTYPNRTSPVKRGVWLLENILGSPPPAPPPDVPPFPEEETDKVMTVRERMENHRKNPVCAACHARIDPLGFAMENFDAVGKWRDRDREAGVLIDASGQLPDGSKFDGPVGIAKADARAGRRVRRYSGQEAIHLRVGTWPRVLRYASSAEGCAGHRTDRLSLVVHYHGHR